MNFRIIVSLLLICASSLCCSPKQEPTEGVTIKIEGDVDPNTLAIVTLKLEGDTLPGTPKVVTADDTSAAFFEKIGSPEYVEQIAQNKWVAILTPGESYVIGWIVEDNKLFGYCSEPFVAENNLEVSFSPGMPVTLEYDLTRPEEGVEVFPAIFLLSRKAVRDGKTALMAFGVREMTDEPKIIKIDGLAQGAFELFAQALKAEDFIESRTRFLYDKRFIEIKPGQVNRIEARYPVLDTTAEDGDITIRGLAHNTAGEVLANEKIKLIPYNFNDKSRRYDLYYPDAVTDSNGYFEFNGVQPGIYVSIKSLESSIILQESDMIKGAFLWVDLLVGPLNLHLFTDEAIPNSIVVEWKDGQPGRLIDLFGKTLVVEVYTSWCTPCQKSLSELNSLAKEYKDNENIVFAALGIDYSKAKWEESVNQSGLDALRHGWYNPENQAAFNRPIPYYMVIDKKGILRAEGNYIDIRAELEKVLKDSN